MRGAAIGNRLPHLVLAGLLLCSVLVLAELSWGLTFYQDTWAYLMHRQDFTADAFFAPHNEHIVVIPVAIEKVLIEVFGMGSATPEYVVLILLLTATAALLYVYVARRLGPWLAVMAVALVLFLGPAWTVLLWPFQVGFVGASLTGLAMLLALDREDRLGDRLACGLLVLCLAFSSLGLPFACAAAVDVIQRARRRGLGRAYIVVVPLALFALWYLGWGHDAESHVTVRNILSSPRYLLEGLAATSESLLGLSTLPLEGPGRPEWGFPLLVALVVLSVAWKVRNPEISPRLLPAAAALGSFWLLAAFNTMPGREATANRYAYAGAILLVVFLSDLFRGVRAGRVALAIGAVVTVAAVASNLVRLDDGSKFLQDQTVLTRADVGAIDIAQDTVSPAFSLTPEIAGTPSLIDVNAAEYLPAMREHGSPGYSAEELMDAAPEGRRQADIVLAHALPISVVVSEGDYRQAPPAGLRCVTVPGGSDPTAVEVQSRVTLVEAGPGPTAEVKLRRFAKTVFPVSTEGVPGNSLIEIEIPPDRASQSWHLQVVARQGARVCTGG